MTKERICEGCCGLPVSKCDCTSDCKVCGGKDNMSKSFRSYYNHFEKAMKAVCTNCGKKTSATNIKCPSCGGRTTVPTDERSERILPSAKVKAAYHKTGTYVPPEYS